MQRLMLVLIHVIANTFFRRIDVVGAEHIPADGPVIFAGNHPNALMDGWLLTAKCGRQPLHFLANAKLWKYRLLGLLLDTSGAIPVYRREEQDDSVDNQPAFERLYEVIESGGCVGIFPEGISHAESQLVRLKTGTARIALSVAARGIASVCILPCGLNYIHRHRFRSQVLIEFGEPILIDEYWLERYRDDAQEAVRSLTELLTQALQAVTLNAPDWTTMRFIQTARRLYKPDSVKLTPGQYIELSRRFVERYTFASNDPEMQQCRQDVENYQARLDMLGIKDHQLRSPMTLGQAFRKLLLRLVTLLIFLPLAVPGALLHLPVGWVAALVGERFSYETDDVATLKVISTTLLLPLFYIVIAIVIGINFGWQLSLLAIAALTLSFFISVRLIETEVGLVNSMVAIVRLLRLGTEIESLRETRAELSGRIRRLAERLADPATKRMFTPADF
ncbi:MAG: 1-acyl-sn-glycerol-3-phosphate acyltransferase [Gammaproteobacteria bacterium]|nr:1-acyl-sn-glycerol-3-phosphate acyltransferase [Gammaproteobacteria bacterium]MDH5302482.1 1-acyl-sn-glycerol-3-phosphate acyltransferase [Gammaproteobacteria bacterium]MDH5321364.1 1-acyl-sn-glycerol-3-phosphate acyltransferase [Gammaproteobacteria bacterium]